MSEGWVIEIRRGAGNPRSIALVPGAALEPWSIGMLADWRVEADGMRDVHGFVYFDGATLYVQSVDANDSVRVNGKAIGTAWTPIAPPCTLALGDARLVYCPASQASASTAAPTSARPAAGRAPVAFDDSAPTIADADALPAFGARPAPKPAAAPRQPPPKSRAPAPAPAPAPPADDDEATSNIPLPTGRAAQHVEHEEDDNETTRALPVPDIAMAGVPRAAPLAAPGPSALGGPPLGALTAPAAAPPAMPPAPSVSASGPIAAPPQVPVVEAKPKPLDQLKAQWKAASLPKKAIVLLLPVAFVMVIFGLDDDAPKKAAPKTAPSVVASADTEKKPEKKKQDEPKDEPTAKPTATAEDLEPTPAPKPKTKPTAAPAPTTTSSAKPANPSTAGSSKTPERLAVDAVAAGGWEAAAKMYDDLAKEHPENPAYKQAARILKAKSKK